MQNPIEVLAYQDTNWQMPFWEWYGQLDVVAADRVLRAIGRLEQGNWSKVKSVGEGVLERKINFGPGYRVYFGRDGDKIVILLAGGTKRLQQQDIETAKTRWQDYKKRRQITGGSHGSSSSTGSSV